ncbi:hypothetical protein ACNJ7K_10750 [Rhodococcus aetherivorans]
MPVQLDDHPASIQVVERAGRGRDIDPERAGRLPPRIPLVSA